MTQAGEGVIYVATGAPHTEAARLSAASLRENSPGLPIAIFTDQADPGDVFDQVLPIENAHARSKVDCLRRTPFDRTLYVDTDTRIVADLGDMMRLLDKFEFAIAHRRRKPNRSREMVWRHRPPEAFPELNSGVMLYARTPRMMGFFDQWSAAYAEAGFGADQITLRELLWVSDLHFTILPARYNTRSYRLIDRLFSRDTDPVILHLNRYHPTKKSRLNKLLSAAGLSRG
ncbi:hypothetical protein [Amaricoccus tamworthensis]|uniref:hypothetical protein n=1 Tax=Amaricoccus tamworthensis TaxID=57002 RepID=UPI003C7EB608